MKFVFNRRGRKGFGKGAEEIDGIFTTEVTERRHREHRNYVTKHFY